MLRLILITIALTGLTAGQALAREISRNADPTENVNSRYTVESVELLGFSKSKLSRTVRERIDKLVGNKYNTLALSGLVWKIREEVRARHINVRVARGQKPEHVAVRLEVEGQRNRSFDLTAPRFGYHSRQGFSGGLDGVINAGQNLRIAGGYSNDADLLLERYQGLHGRAEVKLGNTPVTLRFHFASLHQNWNAATLVGSRSTLYGNREVFEPTATVNLARGLDWTNGFTIQRLGAPSIVEAANAFLSNLTYRRDLEGLGSMDVAYELRAAGQMLGSDYRYHRHTLRTSFTWSPSNRHELRLAGAAGFLNGTAPLFDRYVAGNSTTLRGYNKFDLAPAGIRQLVHASADYRYRFVQLFYDAGRIRTVATRNPSGVLHSVGCGIRKDNMQLAVAFPLRGVRMEPVLLVGVNF
ncbi:hypothetical protein F183_A40160 [Bryobacterales bacterium F-183]|nr:hypothetical protein F183_A40160 [Bryobacterales bacterium F-183]